MPAGGGGRGGRGRGVRHFLDLPKRFLDQASRWVTLAASLQIELCFLPPYSPNLNLIERLWKFVKKPCLYSKYYTDFSAFTSAIEDCLAHTQTTHKHALSSLLTLNFQSFKKAQSLTM